jgi:hypothetical protein
MTGVRSTSYAVWITSMIHLDLFWRRSFKIVSGAWHLEFGNWIDIVLHCFIEYHILFYK